MSYKHPILVPGADGHDDPEKLREALEDTIDKVQNTLDNKTRLLFLLEKFWVSVSEISRAKQEVDDLANYLDVVKEKLEDLEDELETAIKEL